MGQSCSKPDYGIPIDCCTKPDYGTPIDDNSQKGQLSKRDEVVDSGAATVEKRDEVSIVGATARVPGFEIERTESTITVSVAYVSGEQLLAPTSFKRIRHIELLRKQVQTVLDGHSFNLISSKGSPLENTKTFEQNGIIDGETITAVVNYIQMEVFGKTNSVRHQVCLTLVPDNDVEVVNNLQPGLTTGEAFKQQIRSFRGPSGSLRDWDWWEQLSTNSPKAMAQVEEVLKGASCVEVTRAAPVTSVNLDGFSGYAVANARMTGYRLTINHDDWM